MHQVFRTVSDVHEIACAGSRIIINPIQSFCFIFHHPLEMLRNKVSLVRPGTVCGHPRRTEFE